MYSESFVLCPISIVGLNFLRRFLPFSPLIRVIMLAFLLMVFYIALGLCCVAVKDCRYFCWYVLWWVLAHAGRTTPGMWLLQRTGCAFSLEIPQGRVNGLVSGCTSKALRSVIHFNAIPYATTSHRFGAPSAVDSVSHIKHYRRRSHPFGHASVAPQAPRLFSMDSPLLHTAWQFWKASRSGFLGDGEEEMLQMNVWTPKAALHASLDEPLLPVVFYVHGGGFYFGTAHQTLYDGSQLAWHGCVVFSFNYRLGLLGFLCLDAEEGKEVDTFYVPNRGLLDQIAALKWVKANCRHFGGDPDCITISGQSAGSMSVHALMAALGSKAGAEGELKPQVRSKRVRGRRTSDAASKKRGSGTPRTPSTRSPLPSPRDPPEAGTSYFATDDEDGRPPAPLPGQLFHRAVLLSGTGHHFPSKDKAMMITSLVGEVAASMMPTGTIPTWYQGDGTLVTVELRRYLASLPLRRLMELTNAVDRRVVKGYVRCDPRISLLAFSPYVDGTVLRKKPALMAVDAPGSLADVPILLSFTSAENTFFSHMMKPIPLHKLPYRIAMQGCRDEDRAIIGAKKHPDPASGLECQFPDEALAEAQEIISQYNKCSNSWLSWFPRSSNALWDVVNSDWIFRLPTLFLANTLTTEVAKSQRKSPVFVCRFEEASPLLPHVGATHVADIQYWFGNRDAPPWLPGHCGEDFNNLSRAMMKDLLHFVKFGSAPWGQWNDTSGASKPKKHFRRYGDATPFHERRLFPSWCYPSSCSLSKPTSVVRDESHGEPTSDGRAYDVSIEEVWGEIMHRVIK